MGIRKGSSGVRRTRKGSAPLVRKQPPPVFDIAVLTIDGLHMTIDNAHISVDAS